MPPSAPMQQSGPPPGVTRAPINEAVALGAAIRNATGLRNAFILSEILARPVSDRTDAR